MRVQTKSVFTERRNKLEQRAQQDPQRAMAQRSSEMLPDSNDSRMKGNHKLMHLIKTTNKLSKLRKMPTSAHNTSIAAGSSS